MIVNIKEKESTVGFTPISFSIDVTIETKAELTDLETNGEYSDIITVLLETIENIARKHYS